jgi:hypothetical protein
VKLGNGMRRSLRTVAPCPWVAADEPRLLPSEEARLELWTGRSVERQRRIGDESGWRTQWQTEPRSHARA